MNYKDEIDQEVTKIFEQYPEIEYEIEDEEQNYDDINYAVVIKNTSTALQTLVKVRNHIHNSDKLSIYEFLEEQVADQMADNNEYLTADFYIKLKKQGDNMCELLKNFEALKSLMVLMGSYDFNFLSVEDLEEIEATADELQVEITDFFDEIDGMYNADDRIYEIFKIWYQEVDDQYTATRNKIEKILCEVEA